VTSSVKALKPSFRRLSISTYSLGFAILALIPVVIVGILTDKQATSIQAQADIENLKQAHSEFSRVITQYIKDVQTSAKELAALDETISQLSDSTYYQYWKESRIDETHRVKSLMAEVDLFNPQGIALNSQSSYVENIQFPAIKQVMFWNDKGNIYLIFQHPIQLIKMDEADDNLMGYIGIRADLNKLLKQHNLLHSDASSIRWNLSPGSFTPPDQAIAAATLSVRKTSAITAFSDLIRESALTYLLYTLSVFFIIGLLWLSLFGRPLARLTQQIKNLYDGTADNIPDNLHGVAQVTELEHVRSAINDYVNRFQNAKNSLIEKNAALTRLTYRDPLTNTYNRRAFEQHLTNSLENARNENSQHVLCYLDLDQFKVVNDTCGHLAGDELLKQIAFRLQNEIRESDMLARLGGDEFGVILEGCDVDKARQIANNLRSSLEQFRFAWEDKLFDIGVSIGVVPILPESLGSNELLRAADSACYVAKDLGRNRVHVYQSNDKEVAMRVGEMQWVSKINLALEENRFCLYFQPIVPTMPNIGTTHFEILLRMNDGEGQLIPPMAFLPAAERYQLMPKIDRWVLTETVKAISDGRLTNKYQSVMVSINLSGQTLGSHEFLEFATTLIRKSKIAPKLLCFEITETAAITNLYAATQFIATLRNLGCSFSLDDFGSGLSSFGYLKTLSVDYLKIDGHFVRHLLEDSVNQTIVESIQHIGCSMGLKTVAEYVETPQILEELKNIGIDYVQGFAIAEPSLLPESLEEVETAS